jgi:predicted ArsR family transcriptional regulator
MCLMNDEVILVPAGKRHLEGIRKRREIRRLLALGLSKNQMCGELDISTTAINKHLRIIAKEDAERLQKEKEAV